MLEDVCSLPHRRPNVCPVHAIQQVESIALANGSSIELTAEQATDTLWSWIGVATPYRRTQTANRRTSIAERTLPYIMIANKP